MGKIDDLIPKMLAEAKKVDKTITEDLITKVCKYLGASLFKRDASLVAYSDKKELEGIRKKFVQKKLGIKDSDEKIDAAIMKVGEKYGLSNRAKKRAIVYAMLMKHYGMKDF